MTAVEHLFDDGDVLTGRHDIIGDLARLRNEFVSVANDAENRLTQLELLAAAAIELGMSHNIVGKASGIPPGRINAVLDGQPAGVQRCASAYERHSSGAVCRREP